jgi:serine/threonine-protein kinase RsbW
LLVVPKHNQGQPQVALGQAMLSPVTIETTELTLPSRIEAIDKAATAVAGLVNRSGIGEEAAFGIDMAVREALANAVIHGNELDETKLVEINVKSSLDCFEVSVHDQGKGFNPDNISDPTKEENILKSSGRGIFFMRNFFDEVDWSISEGGTTVRMIKRRSNR